MSTPRIRLFGKFSVSWDGLTAASFERFRLQELFSYLLLHRDRHLSREVLAELIWRDCNSEKTRKYLRQALWHLQMILAAATPAPSEQFLLTEHDWVRVNSKAVFWLDVAVFEQAFSELRWKSCSELDSKSAQRAQEAIDLYTGDLLEGCYQDWCLCERERLQNMYLIILDKLMGYSAVTQWYEKALEYGALILSKDRAHERTHRKLMLLQYQAGNRSEALRQYERCCAALAEELDVKPDRRTRALYEQIKQDKLSLPVGPVLETPPLSRAPERPLAEVLDELRMLQTTLHNIHQELQQKIRIVELTLNDHR